MKLHKAGLLAMVLILLTGLARAVWADEEDEMALDKSGAQQTDFIKERSYVGVVGISSTLDQWGDFNGVNYVTSNSSGGSAERDLIPSINRNFGFGVLVGHREGPWAAEVSFWRSDHTASFIFAGPTTITNPASLQSINFDIKRYFLTQFPTQPFINIGFSLPWLWVRGFSEQLDSGNNPTGFVNDETISGIGFNLGAGMEIYLDNNFSVLGGLYQRWTGFDQLNGFNKVAFNSIYFDGKPSDIGSMEGDGLHFYVGATFGYQ